VKELTGKDKELVLFMRDHPRYSQRKIAKEFGVSDVAIHKRAKKLNDKGIIEDFSLTDKVQVINDTKKLVSDLWSFFIGLLFSLSALIFYPSYFPFVAFGCMLGMAPPLIKKIREMDREDYIRVLYEE